MECWCVWNTLHAFYKDSILFTLLNRTKNTIKWTPIVLAYVCVRMLYMYCTYKCKISVNGTEARTRRYKTKVMERNETELILLHRKRESTEHRSIYNWSLTVRKIDFVFVRILCIFLEKKISTRNGVAKRASDSLYRQYLCCAPLCRASLYYQYIRRSHHYSYGVQRIPLF